MSEERRDDKQRAEAERIAWDTIKEYGCHLPERNDVKLAKAFLAAVCVAPSAVATISHLGPVTHRWSGPYHDCLEYVYADGRVITMEEVKGLLNHAIATQSATLPPIPTKRTNEDRSDWYGSGYVDGWNACVDRLRNATDSRTVLK